MSSERFNGYPKSQNIIYSPKTVLRESSRKEMSAIISHDDIYNVIQLIGEGVYGEVTCCRKKSTGQFVAIKTLKQGGCLASEIRILKLFQNVDTNKFHIVHFLESFHSNGRSYLVFELLEQNLMEFQKANNFAPLRVKHMRIIAIQLLRALVKLKELSIIHTDIKPDNIMLVEHTRFPFRVKVIDFGSASILHEVQHINGMYFDDLFPNNFYFALFNFFNKNSTLHCIFYPVKSVFGFFFHSGNVGFAGSHSHCP